jgi:predicted ATP-grasp superfamily ATP-dependent carboligase
MAPTPFGLGSIPILGVKTTRMQADIRPVEPREAAPALILGKGITALAALRSLGRRGLPLLVGGDPGELVTRSRWYRPLPMPAGAAPLSDENLLSVLESLSIPRAVLVPTSDRWAMSVSRLPSRLASRFPTTVAPTEVLVQLVDKARFACRLDEFGVPRPRTIPLRDVESARAVPPEIFNDSFLKPTRSGPFAAVYGAKAMRIRDREDALRLVAEASGRGFEMMLQEFIPGPANRHYFVEGFIDRHGKIAGILARRRLRMYPADFGNSTCTETIPLSDVSEAASSLRRFLEGIGYRGVFSAEFKFDDRDGLFKILEVNARPWWFVGFAARCGMDVCDMAYRDALGYDVEPVTEYEVGRRCVASRLDLESGLADRRAGRVRLPALLRSWIGADQLTLCWDDPKPSLIEMFTWSRSRLRRKIGL